MKTKTIILAIAAVVLITASIIGGLDVANGCDSFGECQGTSSLLTWTLAVAPIGLLILLALILPRGRGAKPQAEIDEPLAALTPAEPPEDVHPIDDALDDLGRNRLSRITAANQPAPAAAWLSNAPQPDLAAVAALPDSDSDREVGIARPDLRLFDGEDDAPAVAPPPSMAQFQSATPVFDEAAAHNQTDAGDDDAPVRPAAAAWTVAAPALDAHGAEHGDEHGDDDADAIADDGVTDADDAHDANDEDGADDGDPATEALYASMANTNTTQPPHWLFAQEDAAGTRLLRDHGQTGFPWVAGMIALTAHELIDDGALAASEGALAETRAWAELASTLAVAEPIAAEDGQAFIDWFNAIASDGGDAAAMQAAVTTASERLALVAASDPAVAAGVPLHRL